MTKKLCMHTVSLSVLNLLVLLASTVNAGEGVQINGSVHNAPVNSQKLSAAISAVRANTNLSERRKAAQKIADMTMGADLSGVDSSTLSNLASLLDISDDGVRLSTAMALGRFVARAKFAAPRLLEVLSEVDCKYLRVGDVDSAPAIRRALQRVGVAPPPKDCTQR